MVLHTDIFNKSHPSMRPRLNAIYERIVTDEDMYQKFCTLRINMFLLGNGSTHDLETQQTDMAECSKIIAEFRTILDSEDVDFLLRGFTNDVDFSE